jgi:hypothetical protein
VRDNAALLKGESECGSGPGHDYNDARLEAERVSGGNDSTHTAAHADRYVDSVEIIDSAE